MHVPYSPSLNTPSFSIEAWVRTVPHESNWQSIATSRQSTPGGYALYVHPTTGQFNFMPTGTCGNFQLLATTAADGSWAHVVGTFDSATKTTSIYVNGQLENSDQMEPECEYTQQTSGPLRIGEGWQVSYTNYYMDGDLDELAYYPRALTPSEIQANHDAGVAVCGSCSGSLRAMICQMIAADGC